MYIEYNKELKKLIVEAGLNYLLVVKKELCNIDYIDIALDDNSKLSYITRDRLDRFENDFFNVELRRKFAYMGKPGKVLKKLSNLVEQEEIVKLQSLLSSDLQFKILEGEDIRSYYHEDRYHEHAGTLNNSCMRSDDCQDFFDIYVEEDDISMLVLIDEDSMLHGRAILWSVWSNILKRKVKVIDRIYGTDQSVENFKTYARDNGIYFKQEQSYSNSKFAVDGKATELELEFQLSRKYDYFPYMDTLKHLDKEENILRSTYDHRDIELTNTDGNSQEYITCECCGCDLHLEESINVEGYGSICSRCADEYFIYIEGVYYEEENTFYCEECSEYYLLVDSKYRTIDDIIICEYCYNEYYVVTANDEVVHRDDYYLSYCEECGEYYYNVEMFKDDYDNDICEQCFNEEKTFYCEECQTYHVKKDNEMIKNEFGDGYVCDNCYYNNKEEVLMYPVYSMLSRSQQRSFSGVSL